MKTNNKKHPVFQYILDCIDTDVMSDRESQIDTSIQKVNYVMDCFNNEYNNDYNKRMYPNNQQRFAQYLAGLPSCFNVAYMYCDILELAEKWGSDVSTEKKQDFICANWFNYMAAKFMQLHSKLNK